MSNNQTSYIRINKVRLFFLLAALFVLISTIVIVTRNIIVYQDWDYDKEVINANNKDALSPYVVFAGYANLLYFTTISNVFLGVSLLLMVFYARKNKTKTFLFNSTTLITITFIIYWVLIAPKTSWNDLFDTIASIILHVINPILGFVGLFLMRKKIQLNWLRATLFPCCFAYDYFIALVALFCITHFITLKDPLNQSGVSFYSFFNLLKPLYISSSNTFVIVLANIFMVFLGGIIPVIFALLWIFIYRLDMNYSFHLRKNKAN